MTFENETLVPAFVGPVERPVRPHPAGKPKQWRNAYDDSADAMEAILAVHFPEGSIIDVNFGLGVFYRNGGRDRVTGVDIRPTGDVIANNKDLPFDADSFDVAVCDPPYKRGDGQKYEHRYGWPRKPKLK
jgi:hypothetical protein